MPVTWNAPQVPTARKPRKPGAPQRLLVFQAIASSRRGGRRKLLEALAVASFDDPRVYAWLAHFGPGTYRLELRDARNWIVAARGVRLSRSGKLSFGRHPVQRLSLRKVGQARADFPPSPPQPLGTPLAAPVYPVADASRPTPFTWRGR